MERPVLIRGGGFHAFWYGLGYGMALLQKRRDIPYIMGYSAGALTAALLAFPEIDYPTIVHVAAGLVPECRIGGLGKVVQKMLTILLPADAHLKLKEGYLRIILCSCADFFQGKVVSHFESKEQLIDCVVASCFIPGIVAPHLCDPVFGCIDGSLSRNLSDICADHIVVETRSHGWTEMFHAITEEKAMELFLEGYDKGTDNMNNT